MAGTWCVWLNFFPPVRKSNRTALVAILLKLIWLLACCLRFEKFSDDRDSRVWSIGTFCSDILIAPRDNVLDSTPESWGRLRYVAPWYEEQKWNIVGRRQKRKVDTHHVVCACPTSFVDDSWRLITNKSALLLQYASLSIYYWHLEIRFVAKQMHTGISIEDNMQRRPLASVIWHHATILTVTDLLVRSPWSPHYWT